MTFRSRRHLTATCGRSRHAELQGFGWAVCDSWPLGCGMPRHQPPAGVVSTVHANTTAPADERLPQVYSLGISAAILLWPLVCRAWTIVS